MAELYFNFCFIIILWCLFQIIILYLIHFDFFNRFLNPLKFQYSVQFFTLLMNRFLLRLIFQFFLLIYVFMLIVVLYLKLNSLTKNLNFEFNWYFLVKKIMLVEVIYLKLLLFMIEKYKTHWILWIHFWYCFYPEFLLAILYQRNLIL